jgi:hypothetical protein
MAIPDQTVAGSSMIFVNFKPPSSTDLIVSSPRADFFAEANE